MAVTEQTYEQCIAKITDVFFGWEDHGILTCSLQLDYGGAGVQSTPGWRFSYQKDGAEHYVNGGLAFLARVMRAAGVDEWSKVKGRTIYALLDEGSVVGLDPLPFEDGQRFIFADAFEGAE